MAFTVHSKSASKNILLDWYLVGRVPRYDVAYLDRPLVLVGGDGADGRDHVTTAGRAQTTRITGQHASAMPFFTSIKNKVGICAFNYD